jgi:ABC-type transport system substrate-binding protein
MGGKISGVVATGLLPSTHHLSSYTRDSLAMYDYDLARASTLLAEAGWIRGSDGMLRNTADGRRLQSVAAWSTEESEATILSHMWKQVGLDVTISVIPRPRITDGQFRQSYPGVEVSSRGYGDDFLERMDCAFNASAVNAFAGINRGHYCDPARMGPLLARYRTSLNLAAQGSAIKEIADLAAQDLPVLQTYFSITHIPVAKGVIAMDDFGGGLIGASMYGNYFRNAHLWDRRP